MPVPASYNDLYVDRALHDHVGDVWYQRSVTIPRGWAGRRILLRFDAACHRAVVWVDDQQVAAHEGGYTPFEADISAHCTPGTVARITVVVNNELSWQSIPPGYVTVNADGSRKQTYYHDFFNYSGLHRSVWLHSTEHVHLDDLTVVTDVDGTTGVVRYTTAVAGGHATVAVILRDASGAVVAEDQGATGELAVADAQLWKPGSGYLYDLEVRVYVGDDVVDVYQQPVGIRTVRVDGTRFLINDEPFYFKGFGMHEDHVVRGKGHDAASMVRDFELLGWIGANSIRTSHYPYAQEVLDHCDRLGIVVIDETAAVGMNLGVTGGFFGAAAQATFSPETVNDATREVHAQALRELVARDKNHPCVVMWCVSNEPESHTPESRVYFEPLFALTRELDPTRPVSFVNMMFAQPGKDFLMDLCDVVMINRYYGWYVFLDDLAVAEKGLEGELRGWAELGKPIIMTEYGADTVAGMHSVEALPYSEEYQVEFLDMYHRVFDRVDAVVGEHVWNFADFATSTTMIRIEGNKKGVFTRDRRPKAAAHALRRRWTGPS
jgi:beta-glucuronidase